MLNFCTPSLLWRPCCRGYAPFLLLCGVIACSTPALRETAHEVFVHPTWQAAWQDRRQQLQHLCHAWCPMLLQGDIESYANMDPRALTDRLEHVSGSEQFKREYERCETVSLCCSHGRGCIDRAVMGRRCA